MNDADGDPEFASDDIKKTEKDIFNEHQLISVDNQDTVEDTNYEDTNYLAYILIFSSMYDFIFNSESLLLVTLETIWEYHSRLIIKL